MGRSWISGYKYTSDFTETKHQMACIHQQEDFTSLTVSDWPCADSEHAILAHGSSSLQHVAKSCCDYVPVNFIDDEVRAMISAWEACSLRRTDDDLPSDNSGDCKICENERTFEPLRPAQNLEPPKKFVRASVSRRKL